MLIVPATPRRAERVARRMIATAFGIGLLVALIASGGIAVERVTRGAPAAGLVANATATLAAICALITTMRRKLVTFLPAPDTAMGADPGRPQRLHALALLLPQIVGAACGIVLVHLVLRHEVLETMPWLSEQPAQLVNDAVATAGLLALAWAAAGGLDARILAVALTCVTMYRVTASTWHVDRAPGGFHFTVQELVVAELVAAALALAAFRTVLDAPEPPSRGRRR